MEHPQNSTKHPPSEQVISVVVPCFNEKIGWCQNTGVHVAVWSIIQRRTRPNITADGQILATLTGGASPEIHERTDQEITSKPTPTARTVYAQWL